MPEYALQNIKRYSTSGRLRTEGVPECMRTAAAQLFTLEIIKI